MLSDSLKRFTAAADLLRPTVFFRTLARVDHTVDATRELTVTLNALRARMECLETIVRLDWEQREALGTLPDLLAPSRIAAHTRKAVAAAELGTDPFPHIVVENWLPADVYRAVVDAVPPAACFASEKEPSRQRLMVPFALGPTYCRQVWAFVANEVVSCILRDALAEKFADAVRDFMRTHGMVAGADFALHTSDGRIMLRRPGYLIAPHRDARWGFVTGLVYLAKPGDAETYGTQLYRVADDRPAENDKPLYVDEDRCTLVRSVPFRANTLLAFLNSTGAHGASIRADAPAEIERFVYQFRLGPDRETIRGLLSRMSTERRAVWAGAKQDKAMR